MVAIRGLNHFNIFSCVPVETVAFYERLGFKVGLRPEAFPDPGVWLYAGDCPSPLLHVNIVTEAEFKKLGAGIVGHVGFSVSGTIEQVTAALAAAGVAYDLWAPIPGAKRALYFHGLNGEYIELVFVDLPAVPLPVAA